MIKNASSPWAKQYLTASAQSTLFERLLRISLSGNFETLDNDAIRHHYVAQFALGHFAIDAGDRIAQIDTDTLAIHTPAIKSAASSRRLYQATQEDGATDNRIEGYLAMIEAEGSAALDRFLERPEKLTDADRATLAVYLSTQMMRTPATAETAHALFNATFRTSASAWFGDLETVAKSWEEATGKKLTGDELVAKRDEIVRSVQEGKVVLSGANGTLFSSLIQMAMEESITVFFMGWHLLESDDAFVTSDRAFSCHDSTPPAPWTAQGLLSSEKSQTVFPLSPRYALMLRLGKPKFTRQKITAEAADEINMRTWGWADRFVYGPDEAALQQLARRAGALGEKLERPRPQFHPWIIDVDPEDNSLAAENEQNGWPRHIEYRGEMHDYILISVENPDPEKIRRADSIAVGRARKRLGLGPDDPLPAPSTASPDPSEIKFHN